MSSDLGVLLLVGVNPDGDLRLDREARDVQRRIAGARDSFRVVHLPAARSSDLIDALNDHRPVLVHFAGHGSDSEVYLENAHGTDLVIETDPFVNLISTTADELRCFVFATCDSESHAIALAKRIPFAVGMADTIDDEACALFSETFYRGLASGRSIGRAFEQAIAIMHVEGFSDHHVPRLHARHDFDVDSYRFTGTGTAQPTQPARLTVTIDADLADLDPTKIGVLMGELRKVSGDLHLEVGKRARGSVKLDLHTTLVGAERIEAAWTSGKLSCVGGRSVLAVSRIHEAASEIQSEPVSYSTPGGGPEWREVESPFLDQLAAMGWKVVTGNLDEPSVTGRQSFREVLMKEDLRTAIAKINLRTGEPWLDVARLSQAISALERIGHQKLIEANQEATRLLLEGVQVEGLPGWDGGRAHTIHFIDWEHPENNSFVAVSQFKVDCPGGQAKGSIRPDITLFVNGIPVVVVEAKSPGISEPIAAAVDQLRRYQNARKTGGEVEDSEGNERLFYTNQFLIATSYDEAKVGTIGADARHYLEWKDTAPVPIAEVQAELNKASLSSQNKLIAGMLRPAHLLDIIRHFTLFTTISGRTVKIVCRYQQYRAVQYAIDRLLHGKTRAEDGEHDRRGGIVWHTQGSGKSLTMVFLVKKMRSIPELRRFKIVVVTDRKDLERQLSATAELTGETVQRARRVREVKTLLSRKGPGIVFAMIQKMQDRDLEELTPEDEVGDLGLLNDDEAILVMVDEAHRSHSSALHGNLLQALPNCARIGFTGTPIIMGAKKRTHDIFGEFIDRYTIKEAEQDGATVPILYEGRTAEGAVSDGRDLDQLFEDLFADRSEAEREAIKRKYGTKGSIFEAERLIEAKAADMLRHYVEHILPNGLKAQVVAYSRRAAVRYQEAFEAARSELVAQALALDETTRQLGDLELSAKPRKLRAAVRAWRSLDALKALEFAAIISPDNNDPGDWREWSEAAKIESRIARFKKPMPNPDEGTDDGGDSLAFLIVKSMLLTGFDAPIEGVMYLDRPLREAELLQAIARVNRTGHGKTAGILVDYYGVARHLKDALSAYSAEDIEGALRSLADEIPKLRDRHARVIGIFQSRDVDPIADKEAAIRLLADERLRAELKVKLKQFLATLDLVLPRPEALPFVRDAEVLGEIYTRARNLYRTDDMPQLSKSIGRKVQHLIDEHVISLGIDPKIPPIAITDAKFAAHVSRKVSDRAKASEMEHAARSHIRKKLDEDPVFYQGLSDRLEEILQKFGEDWKQLVIALGDFVEEVKKGRGKDDYLGLDPELHAPFFDVLKQEREKEAPVDAGDAEWLAEISVKLVEGLIRPSLRLVGFWKNAPRQEELRGKLFQFLVGDDDVLLGDHEGEEIVAFDRADPVADRLMELAKANDHRLTRDS